VISILLERPNGTRRGANSSSIYFNPAMLTILRTGDRRELACLGAEVTSQSLLRSYRDTPSRSENNLREVLLDMRIPALREPFSFPVYGFINRSFIHACKFDYLVPEFAVGMPGSKLKKRTLVFEPHCSKLLTVENMKYLEKIWLASEIYDLHVVLILTSPLKNEVNLNVIKNRVGEVWEIDPRKKSRGFDCRKQLMGKIDHLLERVEKRESGPVVTDLVTRISRQIITNEGAIPSHQS
jgi:hypothetical protein